MSIREDVRNLKTSKNLIRTSIANKGEIIPENTKLELYPYYIDKLKIKEEDDDEQTDGQINEQLPNPVTGISTEYVDDTTLRVSWTSPNDTVQGYDIAWKENGVPTFPLDTNQIVQADGTETDTTITGLTIGNNYGFLVMPKNANGLRQTCINNENSTLCAFDSESLYVAVSQDGYVYHSTNAIDWEYKTRITYGSYYLKARTLCYGNGKFVVGGENSGNTLNEGLIYTSTDGITWTKATTNDTMRRVDNIVFNGSTFVLASYKAIFSSTNGTSWTKRTDYTWNDVCNVACGNGVFVGLKKMSGSSALYTSTDGITWTFTQSIYNTYMTILGFCNDKFIIIAGGGSDTTTKPYYSLDGTTWTQGTLTTTKIPSLCNVIYFNGMYHTYQFESTDGINWVDKPSTLSTTMVVANNLVLRPYTGGKIYISADMATWSEATGLATDVGNYVAIGFGKQA